MWRVLAMGLFKTTAITVIPRASGAFTKGRWGESDGVSYTIYESWQPASQTDIQMLPEGRRLGSHYKFYSSVKLDSGLSGKNPDRVQVSGVTYEITAVAPYQNGLINHYKYIVTEIV
jgi:hypothetical protein